MTGFILTNPVGGGGSSSEAFGDMREPTGFVNRSDSEFSFDVGTRTFTIDVLAPATEYAYYIHGVKYTITSSKSVVIPDTSGIYFFYLDNAEALNVTTTFDEDVLLSDNAYVANLFWNDTPATGTDDLITLGEERHGITMDSATHAHFHQSFGTQYISGLGLNNVVIDPPAPIDTDVQFAVESGLIRDEDLALSIIDDGAIPDNVYDLVQDLQPTAQIPIWFRTGVGADWNKVPASSFPFVYSDGSVFTGANGRMPWNEYTGATWQLTEVSNNSFMFVHYVATNDVLNPIIAIQGTTNYGTIPDGVEEASAEISTFVGLPFQEYTMLASIVVESRNTYTNTPLNRFTQTGDGDDYIDWRDLTDLIGGGGGTSHPVFLTSINGSSVMTYNDPDRGKVLSVSDQTLMFSENRLNNLDWIQVGNANDADSGYIADLDGTITAASGHCENTNAASKNFNVFVNGVDQGSVGTLTGGANASFTNNVLDFDVAQGDRIRIQAQDGVSGNIEDTVIRLTLKWRG